MESLYEILPNEVYSVINIFFNETANVRNHALLSTSIILVIISSINGFRAVTRCINNTFDADERRSVITQAVLGIVLMLIFTLAIVVMLVLLIFGNYLWSLLEPLILFGTNTLYTFISWAISLVVLTIVIMLIYKLSCAKRLTMRYVLPGAIFTVLSWVISSGVFGFFISNFSNMSAIYGSIAGIFILMLWLNLISIILLIGNEINAALYKNRVES
jgi:membrane protein